MFEFLINRWQLAAVRLHNALLRFSKSLRLALINLEQACERNTQLLSTVDKGSAMWSSKLFEWQAHWLFIQHNPRNNQRTKKKR